MRKVALARRDQITQDQRREAAEVLCRFAGEVVRLGQVIAAYWPINSELDCRPLLSCLQDLGAICALPVVDQQNAPLIFRQFTSSQDLIKGPHGTYHPNSEMEKVTPQVILLPLLAFDRTGGRLGYGGGYYDRTLAQLRASDVDVKAIGLGFDQQCVEQVIIDPFDQALDDVLTPSGFLRQACPKE